MARPTLELRDVENAACRRRSAHPGACCGRRPRRLASDDGPTISGPPHGFWPPQAQDPHCGVDIAGTVEAAGRNVTQLKRGDPVYGTCDGSFAEYACAKAERFAPKPANLSFEQAAATISGMTALNGLRDAGKLQPGQKVLLSVRRAA